MKNIFRLFKVFISLIFVVLHSACSQIPSLFVGSRMQGYQDGMDQNTKFGNPLKMTIDNQGNLYVADPVNARIRKVTPDGKVTTFVGTGEQKYQDGDLKTASFEQINDIKFDSKGNLFVADKNRIRKINTEGKVTTFAGSGKEEIIDGTGTEASFGVIDSLFINDNDEIYLIEASNFIRIVSPTATTKTFKIDDNIFYNSLNQILVDKNGDIFLLSVRNNDWVTDIYIYKISKNESAVKFPKASYTGGSMAIDEDGNIYVLDLYQKSIFKISQNGNDFKEIAKLEVWFPIYISSFIKGSNYSNSLVIDNIKKILYVTDNSSIYKVKL